MKVSAILAVLLLVAGMASASISVVTEVSTLGQIGTFPQVYYGVTVHLVGGTANDKANAFDLNFSGSMYQIEGYNGTKSFWLSDVETMLTNGHTEDIPDPITEEPVPTWFPAELTPLAARFDSHMLIRLNQTIGSIGTPSEEASTGASPSRDAFFGTPAGTKYGPKTKMGEVPVGSGLGNMSFAISSAALSQDLPFIYLVMEGTKKVFLNGEVAVTSPGGDYKVPFNNFEIVVPEPATMAMLAIGAVGLVLRRRRRA
jgi:hypothetical protein